MRTGTIRAWAFVHKWSSLVCTAFLLMLCVTGLPLIFHDEIDGLTREPAALARLPEGTALLSLDSILDRALRTRPGEVPLYMSFDTDRPVVNVTTGPVPDAPPAAMHFMSLDQRTGQVLPADEGAGAGIMDFLLQLHTDMFLGLPGMLFLGAMGLLFAVAIVSGVALYAPFMARLPFGAIRRTKRMRVRWTDYHNLLGVTTLLWALVVGLTGVINTLATPVTDYWKARELAALITPYRGLPVPRQLSSVQDAVDKAMQAAPGMRPQFVAFPGGTFSSSHHLAIFLQGRTTATEKLLTPVLVDARSGALSAVKPMPWYMQALLLSQPLHFGDYGGLPLKIIWALLDIVSIIVLGSGLYLWISKGNGRGRAPMSLTMAG
ncbi:PepSY-associated TM helix domain-containing protein [Sphingobium phenoxybenzoativorans]|uniref:PepSY-associated TM helix domain-containing protein n=1 Tax=Sphingobium phenoxybenzoativorans TaxID=1592790 RepID=UPI0008724D8A|nr:PepSY domain-containing protein [Sphingobium phenoxybenzoativorans]